MLGIGGAATIAAKQNLVSSTERLTYQESRLFNLADFRVEQELNGGHMLAERAGQENAGGFFGYHGLWFYFESSLLLPRQFCVYKMGLESNIDTRGSLQISLRPLRLR